MGSKVQTAITPTRAEDYPEWYQQVISASDLAERSPVRGCMVIKAWGYALWENIVHELDTMFKDTGVKNAYFPLLIPESFLRRDDGATLFGCGCAMTGMTATLFGDPEQRAADEEDREHGDDRRRGEAGEGFVGGDVVGRDQHQEADEGGQLDRQHLGHEAVDHGGQDEEEEGDFEGHGGGGGGGGGVPEVLAEGPF